MAPESALQRRAHTRVVGGRGEGVLPERGPALHPLRPGYSLFGSTQRGEISVPAMGFDLCCRWVRGWTRSIGFAMAAALLTVAIGRCGKRQRDVTGEQCGADRIKHLELIQAVIGRLATSYFLVKGWALTLAVAFFAITARQPNWKVSAVGLIPTIAFWLLDGYFLRHERMFRRLYDEARRIDSPVEHFSMDVSPYLAAVSRSATVFSTTLLIFYAPLMLVAGAFIAGDLLPDL